MRHRSFALVALIALALTLFVPSASFAQVQIPEIHEGELPALDTRTATVAPTAEQVAAARSLGAEARWNQFGTPLSLIKHGGYLGGEIRADDAVGAARAWLDANKDVFGLESTSGLDVMRDARLAGSDGHAVVFQQRVAGLVTSPDGILVVGVAKTSDAGWKVAYVSSTITPGESVAGDVNLTAAEAWVESANAVGEDVSVVEVDSVGRRAGWTQLDVAGLEQRQLVRAVAFPTPKRGVLNAYETYVGDEGADAEGYRQVVDADTGAVLFRESAVDHAAEDPTWLVFPAWPDMTPLNEYPWNYPTADVRDLWCWFPQSSGESDTAGGPHCQYVVANSASKFEWDKEARTNTPTFTTTGNNADASENWNNSFFPEPGFRPTSPTRDYVYPWTNIWFENLCNPSNFVADGNDIAAATTNLFAMHNRFHDWSYHLGFREDTWNAQNYNFGVRPEGERDELIGNVQAGAVTGGAPNWSGRDNANMFTRPDGTNSWTNMYLWQPIAGAFYAPCVDGDYDMAVIGHEYTHMIENRMIGKGNRRSGYHAGAMGESASDFNSMEYLNEYGFDLQIGGDRTAGVEDPGEWAVGAYVTGNTLRAIRNYNMAFPSGGKFPEPAYYPRINPLNFSDLGYDFVGPQVHADGEIWSATNFDIRQLFLDRYPERGLDHQRECADGERPVYDCPGNRRWIQLYYDAMLLMPVAPTMLDARDAMLAADVIRFGGANQDLLWNGFARRGFGQDAFVAGPNDSEPIPSFESPLHEEATVVFNAVAKDEGNAPIPDARIYAGHYEARVSPIADTDPATEGANLDNVERFIPDDYNPTSRHRAYDFIAHARGYGHVRFRLDELKPGEVRNVTIRFPTNHASTFKGAVATGDGQRHQALLDDTEATNWASTGRPAPGTEVLVQLGGPRTFDVAKVSAMLTLDVIDSPSGPRTVAQNRFTALREFELYACTATPAQPCDPSEPDTFRRILNSHPDAFPGDNPRPVAPHLIIRTFEVPRTTATHVLLRVIDNQCTGQESFQGEQDHDPANVTDCRTGSPPLPPRGNEVRAAELQLLSSRPHVIGAESEE